MKTIFRFLNTGVLTAAFVAVAATAGFGQDAAATPKPICAENDAFNEVYTRFLVDYDQGKGADGKVKGWSEKTVAQKQAALAAGNEILEKYGDCEVFKANVDYVKPIVESFRKSIPEQIEREQLAPSFKRFDAGIGPGELAKSLPPANIDQLFVAAKEILAKKPGDLNFMVPLAVSGFYELYYKDDKQTKNTKYTDESLSYAQTVLAALKGGKEATKKNAAGVPVYGFLKYTYTKEDLISELNFAIGYLNFFPKNNRLAALPYYYELTQSARYKDDPRIYETIGSYYGPEVIRLNAEIAKLLAEQKAKATPEEQLALEPKIKETIGILNGTAERAMDFYGRAWKLAKAETPVGKAYKDLLFKNLTALYEGRFNKKDGLDSYISKVTANPVPNPTAPITPVNDPEPATTTGTSAPAAAAPASTTATKPAGKPMSTTVTAKPASVAKKGTR